MLETLKSKWTLLVMRGMAAVLFGVLAFIWPGITLTTLIILFAVYAALDGVFALITGVEAPKDTPGRGSLILRGLIGIAASVIAFSYPGITATSLLYLIGAWAIFSGGVEIGAAFLLRNELTNEFLLLIAGGLSILFGVLMFKNPSAGALSVVWLIGSYAIVYGIMLLTLAFKLKRLGGDIRTATGDLTGSLGR